MSNDKNILNEFKKIYQSDPYRFVKLPGVSKKWTPSKLVCLYDMLLLSGKKYTHNEMASKVNLERSTITRKVNNVDWSVFGELLRELINMDQDDVIAQEADEKRGYQLANETVKVRDIQINKVAFVREVEETIIRTIKSIKKPLLPVFNPSNVSKVTNNKNKDRLPENMVLLLSDLHVGLEFSNQETGGLGAYDSNIFRKRAENLRRAILHIKELHEINRKIPKLYILGLGDFVQGSNLGGQWGPAYTAIDVTNQCIVAAQAVSEMIDVWSKYFDEIEFSGVIGNHGRAGVSKSSDKITANWDLMAYAMIKAILSNRKNIKINYSNSWWSTVDINGYGFVSIHGDYLPTSITSLLKEELKLRDLLSSSSKNQLNYMCMGHFHSAMDIETTRGCILINGAWVGGDMHSMHQLRKKSRPTQTVFGVHPKHGMSWSYKLDLDVQRD